MKLYTKRLHSVDELQKEKRKLRREVKKFEKEPILSGFSLSGAPREGGKAGSITDFIPAGILTGPVASTAFKLVSKYMQRRKAAARSREAVFITTQEPVRKKITMAVVAGEVIGGYLKWKAVELAFKGVKAYMSRRRA